MENKPDKYHLHKILGFGCLFHYNLRIYYKIMYGSMYFGQDYITPIIHLSLSLSSFIFHVPKYRYNTTIIIWKELQLHNIIFTSRSVSMMFFSLLANNYENNKIMYIYKLLIILGHHLLSDYVSNKYINENKTTTRDIYYDGIYYSWAIKKFYAISQTFALCALLLNDNNTNNTIGLYENAFLIMYPIQLSTFLMTLVRKKLISNKHWHFFYSLSLSLPYLINYSNPVITKNYLLKIGLGISYTIMRLGFKFDKYYSMIGIVLSYICIS